jgi:hypothetical protein
MKDFSNASFPPETIGIMKDAMDAAVATLPDPISSAHVKAIALPKMAREIPQLCNEWHYWNFKLHRAIEVQSAGTHKICLPICTRSQTEVLRYFHLAWDGCSVSAFSKRHRKPKGIQFANRAGGASWR